MGRRGRVVKLIAVGDNVSDTYLDDGVYYPGGQAVNVAVNAALDGAEQAGYLGVFGDDARADYIRSVLEGKGVRCDRCRRAYAPTARPGVRLVDGDRVFQRGPRDSCQHLFAMNIVSEDLELLGGYDVCHLTNEAHLEGELERIHSVVPISFDFSCDREPAYLDAVCPHIDYAFISGADLMPDEARELAEGVVARGVRVAVVTRGEHGALALEAPAARAASEAPEVPAGAPRLHEVAACPADLLDTMGAGDSFAAAFLVRYLDVHDVAEALAFAAERAARTCEVHGAFGCGHPCD